MGKRYRVGCKGLDEYGKGICVFNNRKFTVSDFLPGEIGYIELVYGKETTAKVVEIEKASEMREKRVCPVYEKCGGCQLLHMKYEEQLRLKSDRINKLFADEAKAGKVENIVAADDPYAYRHKVYATFTKGKNHKTLAGIYEESSHRVVNSTGCFIQVGIANRIVKFIAELMDKTNTAPYNEDKKTGVIRHVYIRVSKKTGKVMVVIVCGANEFTMQSFFAKEIVKKFAEVETVIVNFNHSKTSMVLGRENKVIYGNGYITDELCGVKFKISPTSFFQVNPVQTEKLYQTAMEFAGLSGSETVVDAYCGTGTIGLVAAERAKSVFGIELNKEAIKDAKENAKNNGITNATFVSADSGEYLSEMAEKKEKIDVLFMDPPREGSDEKFILSACKIMPKKIVYVSCNPETLKRDTEMFKKNGYTIEKIRPVDCFCQTFHVETVVLLSKLRQKPDDYINVDIDVAELEGTCLNMGDLFGFEANPIPSDRYSNIIGQIVKGKIDRPIGSFHPRHKDLYYPVNYGYVSGVLGGDGAEQDIYLLGVNSAVQEFTGKVIAVYHRYDDNETKWIVVPCNDDGIVSADVEIPTANEIYAQIAFQEQFFCGVLVK